jgi:hypothetical protein
VFVLGVSPLSAGYSDEAAEEEYSYKDYSECGPTEIELEAGSHISYTAQGYNATAAQVCYTGC